MQLSHFTSLLAVTLGLAVTAACGPATPDPAMPDPAATAPTGGPAVPGMTAAPAAMSAAPAASALPTAPPVTMAFSKMTHEQQVDHMKKVIMPTMSKVFQESDGKKYADFGCKTCHGEKKQDPHMVLPVLKLSGDGFKRLSASKPAVMKLMSEKVTPAMAVAMNEKPYDPATHKGFGCGGCHKVN